MSDHLLHDIEMNGTDIKKEQSRRTSVNRYILLFISRLIARRPRERIVCLENFGTEKRFYTITCSNRHHMNTLIFERGILPKRNNIIDALRFSEISNLPIGYRGRLTLRNNWIPSSWKYVYIRFQSRNSLTKNTWIKAFTELSI